jgi:hypothetical protein
MWDFKGSQRSQWELYGEPKNPMGTFKIPHKFSYDGMNNQLLHLANIEFSSTDISLLKFVSKLLEKFCRPYNWDVVVCPRNHTQLTASLTVTWSTLQDRGKIPRTCAPPDKLACICSSQPTLHNSRT